MDGNVDECVDQIMAMTTPRDIQQAIVGETRKGVLHVAQERIAALQAAVGGAIVQAPAATSPDQTTTAQSDEPPQESQQPADDPNSRKFVFKKGAPGGIVLEPTRAVLDSQNRLVNVPGVFLRAQPMKQHPGLRVYDANAAPEVRRPVCPRTPEQIADLVRATVHFQRGLIIDWNEFEEELELQRQQRAAMSELQQQFEAKRAAKAGKRGAVTAPVHADAHTGVGEDRQLRDL